VAEQTLEDWQRLLDFSLRSCFLCTRVIGQSMFAAGPRRQDHQHCVGLGLEGAARNGRSPLRSAKAAVLQFTRATAEDWGIPRRDGECDLPGIFMTEANERWADSKPAVNLSLFPPPPCTNLKPPLNPNN